MAVMRALLVVLELSIAAPAVAFAGNEQAPPSAPTCTCRTPELGEELLYPVRGVAPLRLRTPELGEELLWLYRTPELGEELVPIAPTPELGDDLLPRP